MIILPQHDILINTTLILSFLGFCAISINDFVFPFIMMSPTILDIMSIIGLPIDGYQLLTFFTLSTEGLGINFSKSGALYLAFLMTNAKSKGVMFDGKHHTFLLYWLCKYFVCTNSILMVIKYLYYILAIAFRGPLVLALIFVLIIQKPFSNLQLAKI